MVYPLLLLNKLVKKLLFNNSYFNKLRLKVKFNQFGNKIEKNNYFKNLFEDKRVPRNIKNNEKINVRGNCPKTI